MAVPAPLPSSTANWHWKNKNVTRWGKEWFERELTSVTIAGNGTEGQTSFLKTRIKNDIDSCQLNCGGRLITIFDCKVVCNWSGTASDGTEVKGTVTIPEVSHEINPGRLYNWSLTTASSPEVDAIFSLARSRLPTALETKFAEFAAALVETHGRDLTVSGDPSRSGTPAPAASSSGGAAGASAVAPAAPKPAEKKSNINTTKITKRIPGGTHASAQSSAKADTEYVLFGGGVKGKYIVQTWALQSPTWPSGHHATLTTTITQGSDSTTVKFVLDGVPTGTEEEIKRNLEGY
ncbi:activator of Hsp90 ATPase [Mycena olivaceomarginata]|nr:activator of Hsp90 ATPase [Mycena olivaceomarginata]